MTSICHKSIDGVSVGGDDLWSIIFGAILGRTNYLCINEVGWIFSMLLLKYSIVLNCPEFKEIGKLPTNQDLNQTDNLLCIKNIWRLKTTMSLKSQLRQGILSVKIEVMVI
jgi:hypothetical protein